MRTGTRRMAVHIALDAAEDTVEDTQADAVERRNVDADADDSVDVVDADDSFAGAAAVLAAVAIGAKHQAQSVRILARPEQLPVLRQTYPRAERG